MGSVYALNILYTCVKLPMNNNKETISVGNLEAMTARTNDM